MAGIQSKRNGMVGQPQDAPNTPSPTAAPGPALHNNGNAGGISATEDSPSTMTAHTDLPPSGSGRPGANDNPLDHKLPDDILDQLENDDFNVNFADLKTNTSLADKDQISTAIPGTGLKANLHHIERGVENEYKDVKQDVHHLLHGHKKSNGHPTDTSPHTPPKDQQRIPAGVQGEKTGEAGEAFKDQEGAEGTGPGRHENHISSTLVDGQGGYSLHEPDGSINPVTDSYAADQFADDQSQDHPAQSGTPRDRQEDEDDELHHEPEHFKDELGRVPPTLKGVKKLEAPGPRNEIVLKARVVETQFKYLPPDPCGDINSCDTNYDYLTDDDSDSDGGAGQFNQHGRHFKQPSKGSHGQHTHHLRDAKHKDKRQLDTMLIRGNGGKPEKSKPPAEPHRQHSREEPAQQTGLETQHDDARGIDHHGWHRRRHHESQDKGQRKTFAETDAGWRPKGIPDGDTDPTTWQAPLPPMPTGPLDDPALGRLPPGVNERDWDGASDDEDGWRSALGSGANTPITHPADPSGEHDYWSTFRQREAKEARTGSRPASIRSRTGSFKQNGVSTPPNVPVTAQVPRVYTHNEALDQSTRDEIATPKTGGMRKRFGKMLPGRGNSTGVTATDRDAPAPTMTTELLAGTLPVMILKTWIDRDEDDHRAVPVLLGNLRFRIGDSVPLRSGGRHTGREMFKIECEYGDGAIKWVVYRELRDFVILHAHYKAANLGTRVTGLRSSRRVELPEFPRNSLPMWAREKAGLYDEAKDKVKEKIGSEKDRNELVSSSANGKFGPASRAALQQYLVDLIRAVLFRPESNRLCIFFELSALTVALAPRGGFQGKAGFLKILSTKASRRSNQPGLKPSTWRLNRTPKWYVVRESYFVSANGPEDTDIYDVFLLDGDFAIERPKRAYRKGLHLIKGRSLKKKGGDSSEQDLLDDDDKDTSHHTFYISNAQRRIKLVAKNARQMHQFIVSMERIAMQSVWTGRNRFDSFAPVRVNVAAQWLVDGRDYFWNLSRAINMAKSRIYIHDWWISPEIYLRRPGDERYRLDNLLKRKAEEGVRVFIIIYNEVSQKTTPVDSIYVKRTLTGLHPNIMVQRSPSHLPNGALYWSHHEKLCVIDEAIGFMGGLDLCFGRWDTSQHVLTDEDYTAPDGPNGPVWRGKDYWNERVAEYHDLDKPFVDEFDRDKTPRMPWHDVGLQIVGQPARDLCRHFVQRWNWLLRTKNHTRKMPFLLPAADFTEQELTHLGLRGTCEVQICRSVGPWSMGTQTKIEHSVQNAYIKSIQLSEHFVYIENQFFITSTVVDTTTVENRIGDAIVNRIIKAHAEKKPWRCCVVIPLLPGYTHPIDSPEAGSLRLILECQNRTISRGTRSIFTRLRKEGIDPDDYIGFFSLRGWAKFKSGALTTEQVYIHGKTMIVDDRLVLCGSANINDRSQMGDRDSELVSVVRDTDMIDGTMAGKPFKVGRYAHTLRMRLMREHIGVDVDAIEEDELLLRKPLADEDGVVVWDPDNEQSEAKKRGITRVKKSTPKDRLKQTAHDAVTSIARGMGENAVHNIIEIKDKIKRPVQAVEGQVHDLKENNITPARMDVNAQGEKREGFASSVVPTLEERTIYERRPDAKHANGTPLFGMVKNDEGPDEATVSETFQKAANEEGSRENRAPEKFGVPAEAPDSDDRSIRHSDEQLDGEDEDKAAQARTLLRKHLNAKVGHNAWNMPTPTPKIDPNRFHDPLDERFWKDMWIGAAVHNTEIFRKVFRCVPDDLVTSWAQYKAFANRQDKFGRTEEAKRTDESGTTKVTHDEHGSGGGVVGPAGADSNHPSTGHDHIGGRSGPTQAPDEIRSKTSSPDAHLGSREVLRTGEKKAKPDDEGLKPSGDDEAWHQWELDDMEQLLNEIRGHLVLYPTRFLEGEDLANNFLFNQDRILPMVIYD